MTVRLEEAKPVLPRLLAKMPALVAVWLWGHGDYLAASTIGMIDLAIVVGIVSQKKTRYRITAYALFEVAVSLVAIISLCVVWVMQMRYIL